jgi:hypothetical protein
LPDAEGPAFAKLLRNTMQGDLPPLVLLGDPEKLAAPDVAGILRQPVEGDALKITVRSLLAPHQSGVMPVEEDYRRHSRIDVELALRYAVGNAEPRPASCMNLSLGGMFIRTDEKLPHDTTLRVWLRVPGAKTSAELMVSGTVRWATGDGVGIQHELLGARDTYLLSEFLASIKH